MEVQKAAKAAFTLILSVLSILSVLTCIPKLFSVLYFVSYMHARFYHVVRSVSPRINVNGVQTNLSVQFLGSRKVVTLTYLNTLLFPLYNH